MTMALLAMALAALALALPALALELATLARLVLDWATRIRRALVLTWVEFALLTWLVLALWMPLLALLTVRVLKL